MLTRGYQYSTVQAKMMLFIVITCTCVYSVSTEIVQIIKQPMTDKECYEEGDNASLTLSFNVTGTTPLHFYKVLFTPNLDRIGEFVDYNGSVPLFDDTLDRDMERFQVTTSNVSRNVEFRMDVTSLEFNDEHFPLYAVIYQNYTRTVLTKSSVGAQFYVNETCQQPTPTVTTAPSNDITSKGNILAKPGIPGYGWALIGIGVMVVVCIICCWCIKRHLQKGKRRNNGNYDPTAETTV